MSREVLRDECAYTIKVGAIEPSDLVHELASCEVALMSRKSLYDRQLSSGYGVMIVARDRTRI